MSRRVDNARMTKYSGGQLPVAGPTSSLIPEIVAGTGSFAVRHVVQSALMGAAFVIALVSGCSTQPSHSAPTPKASTSKPAAPTLNGTYAFVTDGSRLTINGQPRAGGVPSTTTWEITPCGPDCGHVKSSLGWTAELHLLDSKWQATRQVPDICNGEASAITYVIDADTLSGTATNSLPCTHPPSVAVLPARLVKK